MPPTEYNPNNAGEFEAIKVPEKPKGPEKQGPDYAKLEQLKVAAEARKAELQKRELAQKQAEVPQIDAARHTAQELAVSGSPGKSFMELSPSEKAKLAQRILSANAERLEGNQAVANGDTSPIPVEKPAVDQNRQYQESQSGMVLEVKNTDWEKGIPARPKAETPKPAPKKPWYQVW